MKKRLLLLSVAIALVVILTGTAAFAATAQNKNTNQSQVTSNTDPKEAQRYPKDIKAAIDKLTPEQKAQLSALQTQLKDLKKARIDKLVEFKVITTEQAAKMKARIESSQR